MKVKKQKVDSQQSAVNGEDKAQVEQDVMRGMLARALADYENLKRRTEEEKLSWAKFSSLNIVSKLLPIMDMLESAQAHLKDSGLAIAISEFKKVFIEEGLEEIKPEAGSEFDENLEEVIEVVDGTRNNIISEVVVPGWKFKDPTSPSGLGGASGTVVRHAKVKVFKVKET